MIVNENISRSRSVEKKGGEVLGFEAEEWKTRRKRLMCKLHQKQKDDAKRMTMLDVKICRSVAGGWM